MLDVLEYSGLGITNRKENMEKEIEQLLKLLAQIDYLYQEGVICYPSDAKTMDICAEQLSKIAYDIRFQKAYKNG